MVTDAVAQLKTFSPLHRSYIVAVLTEILQHYRDNLSGLAIFGSYARRENRKNSDLDLLIILQEAPRRRERLVEFIDEIELKHEHLAQRLYDEEDILCELSPYILREAEALRVQPIYFDLVSHHVVVSDPKGIVARIIASMWALLRDVGAHRVRRNNTWEWQTRRFLGGIKL
ncbi:MAG: nucleotidyltransferase domain-containing protein [Firmicutes bacterium]|nr:nucleotidyltransferase domain-containing protein [Bacillota bacterium]